MQEGPKKIVRTVKTITKKEIVKQQNQLKSKKITYVSNIQQNQPDNTHSQLSQESLKYSKSSQLDLKQKLGSEGKSEIQFFTTNDYKKLQDQLNQLKIMQLSEDIREKLIKMQRFDRLNYLKQTQKLLKQPIEAQMRRLEKIKNEKKQMRTKYYDNQLTITCLHYHHKLISQYNELSSNLQQSKSSKSQLQRKNFELLNQLKKQKSKQNLKTLQKSGSKSSITSQNQFSKQLQSSWNFSLNAMSNEQYLQAKKQFNFFIQKAKSNENHFNLIKMMEQIIHIINIHLNLKEQIKKETKQKNEIVSNGQLINKYIRQQKWNDLQKLKNKLKTNKQFVFYSLLIQSITQNFKKSREKSNQKLSSKQNAAIKLLESNFEKQKKTLQQQIEKLKVSLIQEKLKIQKKDKYQSQSSSTPSRVNLQELKNLQFDFNELSKLKQQEQENYLKTIEEKDERIKQYQQRLTAIDKIQNQNFKSIQILTIQVQQKDKQILNIKKQLIRALQQKESQKKVQKVQKKQKNNQGKDTNQKSQVQSLKILIQQILKIKLKKNEEVRGKAFQLQLNTLEREQWRQVSKKIKQFKKKQAKNKYVNYIDQKHKREFDLVEKLIDYEDKTLLIHNHIYKAISITNKTDGWWNNKEALLCRDKTQFANLFNKLMQTLFQVYSTAKFQPQKTQEEPSKQFQQLKGQVQQIKFTIQQLQKYSVKSDKLLSDSNYICVKFTELKNRKSLAIIQELVLSIETFLKASFQYVAKNYNSKLKEIQLSKKQTDNLKLSQTNLKNQISQLNKKLNFLIREKESLQKNKLQTQKLQTQVTSLKNNLQAEKKRVKQLQEQNKKFLYYKELIQQEEKIIETIIFEEQAVSQLSSSSYSQMTIQQKGVNLVSTPKAKTILNQNTKKQNIQQFLRKYPKNKTIQYISNLKNQTKRLQQEIISKQEIIQELSINIDWLSQTLQSTQKYKELLTKRKYSHSKAQKIEKLCQIMYRLVKTTEQSNLKMLLSQKELDQQKDKVKSNDQLKKQVQSIKSVFYLINQKLNQSVLQIQTSTFVKDLYQIEVKKRNQSKLQKGQIKNKPQNQNSLLQTIFVLTEKVIQILLNYQGDLIQKINQIQSKFKENIQKLKDQKAKLNNQLDEISQKLKLIQKQNKGLVQNQTAYLQIQTSYQQLKSTYNNLVKNKNEDQSQIRQLQIFKKQLEQQRNLIDKILKGNNEQQKKQLVTYKKLYPKSKFCAYFQLQSKKINSYTSKISSFQIQAQKLIQFFNKFNRLIKQDQAWFKKDFNDNLPGQIGSNIRQLVKSYAKIQSQLSLSQNKTEVLEENNLILNQESKQLACLKSQLQTFSQILQNTQKIIQKPKQELFTNQFYLKNLIDNEIKKRKLNLQLIYNSLSELVHELSCQISNRELFKNQNQIAYKKKLQEEKNILQEKLNEVNLKFKQSQIVNKQLSTQNKLIKQSLTKLQSSSNFLDQAKKSLETSEKIKQYEILRLKQTIEGYVKQQTRLQIEKNKAEKDKKQLQRQVQKLKRQVQKWKQEHIELRQQKQNLSKLIQNLKENSFSLQKNNEENEVIINNLKINYNQTERQLKSIQFRVSSLLQQKQGLIQEVKLVKSQSKSLKQQTQRQINTLKGANQKLQNQLISLKRQSQGLKQKNKHFEQDIKIQKNHLQQIIKKLQKQFSQSTQLYQKQKKDLLKKLQTITQEKLEALKQLDNQKLIYRQKMLEINLIGSNQTDIQHNNLRKQIEDSYKKNQQSIKSYQIEKQELRKYIEKINSQYQESIFKSNQQRKNIIDKITKQWQQERKSYHHQINDNNKKISTLEFQKERLINLNDSNKLNFNQLLTQNNKLQKENQELQLKNSKLENKILNLQRLINESQQNLLKMTSLQRKVKQFQSLVQIQSFNSQSSTKNALQTKLNQLQLQKKNNQKLSSQLVRLKCEIDKLAAQNQLIQNYSKNNRQQYLKFMSQSKQNIQDLKEQNKFLIKEKQIIQNQLNQLNHLLKSLSQKNQHLSEQIKRKNYQSQVNPIQGQLKVKLGFAQIQLKQKQAEKFKIQNELLKQKSKIEQLRRQTNSLQKRNTQLVSKLKQIQYRSSLLQQKQTLANSSEVQSLTKQIADLKTQNFLIKKENENQLKISQNIKADFEQSRKQLQRYQFQIQSNNKISLMENNHLKQKIIKLEQELHRLNQDKKNVSYKYQSTMINFNKDLQSKIKELELRVQNKNKHLQKCQSKIQVLQKNQKQLQKDYNNLNRLVDELQRKNQQKLKQINKLSKENMELDIKYKEIERNWKYFQIQSQKQIQLQKEINRQLQKEVQLVEKQVHHKIPISPITYDHKQLEQQKFFLMKQLNNQKAKRQQLQIQILNLKKKSAEITIMQDSLLKKQLQISTIKSQLQQTFKNWQQLIRKNNKCVNQNSQLKAKCKTMQQQYLNQKEKNQVEKQKIKNSERVLQHQIMEHKSKLQNVQAILRQQKQKTYNLRMELQAQRYKDFEKISDSDHRLRHIHNLELQSEKQHANISALQKKNYHLEAQINTLIHDISLKQQQNQNLKQILFKKDTELKELRNSSQQMMKQIVEENVQIKDLLKVFQDVYKPNRQDQENQQNQLNILFKISSQVEKIILKNKELQNSSKKYKDELNLLNKSYLNQDFLTNNQTFRFYLQKIVDNLTDYVLFHVNSSKKKTLLKEFMPPQLQFGNIEHFFKKHEQYLKYLFDFIFDQLQQSNLVCRYQNVIQKMKQTICNYLQTQDLQVKKILIEMVK